MHVSHDGRRGAVLPNDSTDRLANVGGGMKDKEGRVSEPK